MGVRWGISVDTLKRTIALLVFLDKKNSLVFKEEIIFYYGEGKIYGYNF
jgi:hypothetical protein